MARLISVGSRPTRRSARRGSAFLCANVSGAMNGTFQPSAYRAAIFSVRFSPPPPIQMGSFACTGRGSLRASVSVKCWPSKVVTSSCSRPRRHWMPSSSWSMRVFTSGNGMPYASYSTWPSRRRCPCRRGRRQLVDGGDRLGQHRRVAVADGVHERAAAHLRWCCTPARRASRRPRGRRRRRAGRWRRRSGPRSRSSRSRGPRSAATPPRSSSAVVCCSPVCTPKTVMAPTVVCADASSARRTPEWNSSTTRSARPTIPRCCSSWASPPR